MRLYSCLCVQAAIRHQYTYTQRTNVLMSYWTWFLGSNHHHRRPLPSTLSLTSLLLSLLFFLFFFFSPVWDAMTWMRNRKRKWTRDGEQEQENEFVCVFVYFNYMSYWLLCVHSFFIDNILYIEEICRCSAHCVLDSRWVTEWVCVWVIFFFFIHFVCI